jgi:hypothetical protein
VERNQESEGIQAMYEDKKCGDNIDPRELEPSEENQDFFYIPSSGLLQRMLALIAMHTSSAYPRCCLARMFYTTLLDQGYSRPV